jgi:flagellar FliJ protein
MSRFKFRLQTLLRLRDAVRDERRAELAQAYQADEILQGRRRQIEDELARLRDLSRAAALPGAVDVDRLLDARRYELVLRSQQQVAEQQQRALGVEIDRRRQVLVEANREVRVLETLRDKQQDRHRQEEARQETKRLDEAAARRPGGEEGP